MIYKFDFYLVAFEFYQSLKLLLSLVWSLFRLKIPLPVKI